MSSWTQVQAALQKVFEASSGYAATWQNEPQRLVCQGGKATLEIKGLRRSGFVDDMVYESIDTVAMTLVPVARGYRVMRVTVTVESPGATPFEQAPWHVLEDFILRLRMPGVLAVLSSTCLGIVRINDVQTISATLNGQRVTRSVVDIDFAVGVEVRDCPLPYIDSVCFESPLLFSGEVVVT